MKHFLLLLSEKWPAKLTPLAKSPTLRYFLFRKFIICNQNSFSCVVRYERAEKHFEEALKLVRSIDDSVAEKWEPLLNNLGHVSRKRGKFLQALDFHQQVG